MRTADDSRQPSLNGIRALVADDNADLAELLSSYLQRCGCSVEVAANGVEALRIAERSTPSVALLDIEMPNMDGYTLALHLRTLPGWKDVPLVAFTAHHERYHWDQAIDVGFTSYVTKPVDMLAVAGLIQRLCVLER